ncbi:MAG: NAD(+)--dinitrogen-reductase ADP-D-ribosyltransferase [Opitutaceae bacterium]|nr:NAD(+)--dinitrogen-reductase ADP-D-ribosyltransferase [Opitutaceae bacterium]
MPLRTPFNHCQVPPWQLAAIEFQQNPVPLELGDVLITDRKLWRKLDELTDRDARAWFFHDYLSVKFSLHAWSDLSHTAPARNALRHSYVHCLRHWGVESNGPSGAALKHWVESRFGLRPTYHGGRLAEDETARMKYVRDRVKGAAHTMGLFQQLDLLYTHSQRELVRQRGNERWLTLYRGTHDSTDYWLQNAPANGRRLLVELNNLSSFTEDPEVAWEFGSSVWRVQVPVPKVLCFPGILPPQFLQGESECLVLGGVYEVERLSH